MVKKTQNIRKSKKSRDLEGLTSFPPTENKNTLQCPQKGKQGRWWDPQKGLQKRYDAKDMMQKICCDVIQKYDNSSFDVKVIFMILGL